MILEAKDLSPSQKAVIEDLLGRQVFHDETISIRAIDAPRMSEARRRELVTELQTYFAKVDAKRKPGTKADEEEILNEAMRSVRPGYRLHK
jgi:hypothetical protein